VLVWKTIFPVFCTHYATYSTICRQLKLRLAYGTTSPSSFGAILGIAFITMENETAATNSKNGLDGQNFGPYGQADNSARTLHVDYARPKDNFRKNFNFSRKPRNNSFSRRSRY